jgi:hypothetical protein
MLTLYQQAHTNIRSRISSEKHDSTHPHLARPNTPARVPFILLPTILSRNMFFLRRSVSQYILATPISTLIIICIDSDETAGFRIAVPSVALRLAELSYPADVEADAAELADAFGVAHSNGDLAEIFGTSVELFE